MLSFKLNNWFSQGILNILYVCERWLKFHKSTCLNDPHRHQNPIQCWHPQCSQKQLTLSYPTFWLPTSQKWPEFASLRVSWGLSGLLFLESERSSMSKREERTYKAGREKLWRAYCHYRVEHGAQFITKTIKKEKLGIWKTIHPLWALASFKKNLDFNSSTIPSSNKISWRVK